MPKYMAVHVVLIAGLVVAVTFQVFQSRALTIRLQALESGSLRVDKSPLPQEDPPRGALLHPDELQSRHREPESPAVERNAPRPDPPASEEVLISTSLEQAVARQVDRILAEKYGHLPKIPKPEELEKLLAKELNLTESQKARIAELLARKREEMQSLLQNDPGPGLPLKKSLEIDRRYDTLIKNELDAAQQAKYDQLKKEGKIGGGIVVQIDVPEKD